MNKKLKTWCDEKGYTTVKEAIYGKEDNVYFSIIPAGNFTSFAFDMSCPSQNLGETVKENLKEANKKLPNAVNLIKNSKNNLLIFNSTIPLRGFKIENLDIIISTIISTVQELGGTRNTNCIHCGTETNTHVLIEGASQVMCDQCINNLTDLNKTHKDAPISYATGIVGAIIGALIGGIPWFLLLYSGWVVGILAFVIGFVSFIFYKLFKGPKNRFIANLIIYLASIFSVIAWLIFYYGYQVETILNIKFSFRHLFVNSVLPYFLRDLGISLFIALAGLIGLNQQVNTYTIQKTPEKLDI